MNEDLRRFPYFHILVSALPWSMKSGIWQVHWLDLVDIYQYAKNSKKKKKKKKKKKSQRFKRYGHCR